MTIKELLESVANLVEEREIIDHGSIRCLYSEEAVRSIQSAEDVEEVDTGTIGDNDLASKLRRLAEDPGDVDTEDLRELDYAHLGNDIEDYVEPEAEDELEHLSRLIEAAREL